MYRVLMLFLCGASFLFADTNGKPNILVLSCQGGYGHTAAAKTMQTLLSEDYTLKVVHPINEIRFFGIKTAEDMYNSALSNGWINSMNFAVHYIAPTIVRTHFGKAQRIIQKHINEEKPDLIISLIPYLNLPASKAARDNNIPYLMIPVDFDLKNYVLGMENFSHPEFKVTVGTEQFHGKGRLLLKGIPEKDIVPIGLPLRPDFYEEKNVEELKKTYQIPADKHVVLLMMGGAGGKKALEYAKKIGTIKNLPIHLIVCCGRNQELKQEIEKLSLPSATILGFTDKVADLMAIADILVSKPGPGTLNEAIAMRLPVLADATSAILYWEKANIDMLEKMGVGSRVRNLAYLPSLLECYLTHEHSKTHVTQTYASLPQNQFNERIKEIIYEMLCKKDPHSSSIGCLLKEPGHREERASSHL